MFPSLAPVENGAKMCTGILPTVVREAHGSRHTQRNIFEILLNQPEIRLYLPFSS